MKAKPTAVSFVLQHLRNKINRLYKQPEKMENISLGKY